MKPVAFLLAAVALAAFCGLVPFESTDVSGLCPVQLLCFSAVPEGVRVLSDGGAAAVGKDVPSALEALRDAVPGRLLLETADQIVVTGFRPDARQLLDCGLRPAVRIYLSPQTPEDPDALAAYLSARSGSLTLGKLSDDGGADQIPRLIPGENGPVLTEDPHYIL